MAPPAPSHQIQMLAFGSFLFPLPQVFADPWLCPCSWAENRALFLSSYGCAGLLGVTLALATEVAQIPSAASHGGAVRWW